MRTPARPQVIVPSQPRPQSPLSSLLDYEDDDDVIGPQPAPAASTSRIGQGSELASQPSPVTPHRQIQIPAYNPEEPPSDAEDDLLEALVTNNESTKPSPSPSLKINIGKLSATTSITATATSKPLNVPPVQRDKRRRDEDDDDELLERLAAKSKRANSTDAEGQDASPVSKPTASATASATNKPTVEGPKKFKMKIGISKGNFDGTSQSSQSRTGAKDGDEG